METCTECLCDIDPEDKDCLWTCYNGLYVCAECDDQALADSRGNTNCLAGMRCPQCRALEPFRIAVTKTVLMCDEGSEDDPMGGDEEWNPTSYCECHECGHYGTVKDFTEGESR